MNTITRNKIYSLINIIRGLDVENAKKEIDRNVSVLTLVDEFGSTFLMESVIDLPSKLIQYVLRKGANINAISKDGESCVSVLLEESSDMISGQERIEKLSILLSEGYAIDQKLNMHRTVLHIACIRGEIKAVKLMVEKEAKIDAGDFNDETPLMLSARWGNFDIYDYLVTAGADPRKTNMYGISAELEKKYAINRYKKYGYYMPPPSK